MNKITFILALFKPTNDEINYWVETSKTLIKEGHQFIVINDNPSTYISHGLFEGSEIINNSNNLGKFNSVLHSRNKWKNKFIKTLDPDDYISLSKLDDVVSQLNDECIYRMDSYRINKKIKVVNQEKIDKIFLTKKPQRIIGLGTSWTILPKSGFDNLDEKIIDFEARTNEDQLLGQICLSKGFEVKDIEGGFYLYVNKNGVSSKRNINKYLNGLRGTISAYNYLRYQYDYVNVTDWPDTSYYYKILNSNSFMFPNQKKKNRRIYNEIIELYNEGTTKQKHKGAIYVCFVSDSNQYLYAITNAYAILKQHKMKNEAKLIIKLVFDVSVEKSIYIKKVIDVLGLSNNVELEFVNMDDYIKIDSKISHITPATNIRLFLPLIFKDIDNILYLDNDTFVDGDIADAFGYFEEDKAYGRPWDSNHWWVKKMNRMGFIKDNLYVNAGVIHLPLKRMREEKFNYNLSNFYKRNKKVIKYADQDIINSFLDFSVMPWNLNLARDSWPKKIDWFTSITELKIYHFLSKNKQWSNDFLTLINDKGSLNIEELLSLDGARLKWLSFYEEVKEIIKDV